MKLVLNAVEHEGVLLDKYNNLSDIEELVLTGDFYNISNSFNNCPKLKKVSIVSVSKICNSFNNCIELNMVMLKECFEVFDSFNGGKIRFIYIHDSFYSLNPYSSFRNEGYSSETLDGVLNKIQYLRVNCQKNLILRNLPDTYILHLVGKLNLLESNINTKEAKLPNYIIIDTRLDYQALLEFKNIDVCAIYFSDNSLRNYLTARHIPFNIEGLRGEVYVESKAGERVIHALGIKQCKVISGIPNALELFHQKYKESLDELESCIPISRKLKLIGVNPELIHPNYIKNAVKLHHMAQAVNEPYNISEETMDFMGCKVPIHMVNFYKLCQFIFGGPILENGSYNEDLTYDLISSKDYKLTLIYEDGSEYKRYFRFVFRNKVYTFGPHSTESYYLDDIVDAFKPTNNMIKHLQFKELDCFCMSGLPDDNSSVVGGMIIPPSLRRTVRNCISKHILSIGDYTSEGTRILTFNVFTGQVALCRTRNIYEYDYKESDKLSKFNIRLFSIYGYLTSSKFNYVNQLNVIKTFNSLEEIVGDTCGIEQLIHK